jgi:hypothetical protein
MIIDFHTHIFPRNIRERRESYFHDEPEFKLLYSSPKSRMVGAREMIAVMDETGVDVSLVFGFPWRRGETCKAHNDYVMEAVARYPGRLLGLACLDPFEKNAVREVRRCLEQGLSGIGELAFYDSGIDERCLEALSPLMALCREKGLPSLIHTNEPVGHQYPGKSPMRLGEIYTLAKRFPENIIVLAHWGGGIFFYHLLKKEAKDVFRQVYFDTAASPYLYDPAIYASAIGVMGAGKILFGSDYPLIRPTRYFKEIDDSGISDRERTAILGENARSLLKL